MSINVTDYSDYLNFEVTGTSYIKNPQDNTAMYVSKKVEYLVDNLYNSQNCLVFAELGVIVPEEIKRNNCFVFCANPQLEYVHFLERLISDDEIIQRTKSYVLTEQGYYIGENVRIGENAYIEPGCIIGHNVVIGKNATIYANVVIKESIIGENLIVNENTVIGAHSFTMTKDEFGNRIRIPTLGKIRIGDNVEIGPLNNITRGQAGDTIIGNYCKLGSLVEIGHDDVLGDNVELAPGVIVGGATEICSDSYAGLNVTIRNRIVIGEDSYIGMASNVTKSIDGNIVVVGNPAKPLVK